MRKEILFAILLGILLGSIILYGTYIANKATSNLTSITPAPTVTAAPSVTPPVGAKITVTFPYNNYVSFSDKINITGTCLPSTPIAVISEKGEDIVYTDNQGKFDLPVILVGGENTITLSIPSLGAVETTTLSVIYTTAEIKF